MDRVQGYRDQAAAAERMAAEVTFPDIRQQYLTLAQGWRALATHAERLALRRDSFVALERPFISDDPD
jgi:hypothetical protein